VAAKTGDFSEDMRRGGAAGDDWSDWEAHLPSSPDEGSLDGGGGSLTLDSLHSGSRPSSSLTKQTSDKFEASEGVPVV
jgi:hypothetical protein